MNLKRIRTSRNLKTREVADYLCCSPSVYSRYENGQREPSLQILLKLSKLYGISVDHLIGNDEIAGPARITPSEEMLILTARSADERARRDALTLLELHQAGKHNPGTASTA